jgi:hypothetical protein
MNTFAGKKLSHIQRSGFTWSDAGFWREGFQRRGHPITTFRFMRVSAAQTRSPLNIRTATRSSGSRHFQ